MEKTELKATIKWVLCFVIIPIPVVMILTWIGHGAIVFKLLSLSEAWKGAVFEYTLSMIGFAILIMIMGSRITIDHDEGDEDDKDEEDENE